MKKLGMLVLLVITATAAACASSSHPRTPDPYLQERLRAAQHLSEGEYEQEQRQAYYNYHAYQQMRSQGPQQPTGAREP